MSTPIIAPESHHPEGPSNWPAWNECACYDGEKDLEDADVEALIAKEDEDDSAKGRGTAMHKALAKVLTRQPEPFTGLSDDEEKQVRWVAETVIELAAAAGYQQHEIEVEERVTLLGPDFKPLYFGTRDIRFGPFIADAKFGDEREYITQMAGYALPTMENEGLERMQVRIIYGRLKRVRSYVLDRAAAEIMVYGILNRRRSPVRQPRLCSYCHWCANRGTCSAVTGVVSTIMDKREDWPMKLPTAHITEAAGDPVVAGALRFLWMAYIKPWGESVEYLTKGMASNGIKPLGFRLQNERGRAAFTSSKAIANAMLSAGVSPEQLADAAKFSMEKLAEAYRAQFGGTKDGAAEKVEEILTKAGVMTRGDAAVKLVREKNASELLTLALARKAVPVLAGE